MPGRFGDGHGLLAESKALVELPELGQRQNHGRARIDGGQHRQAQAFEASALGQLANVAAGGIDGLAIFSACPVRDPEKAVGQDAQRHIV